jgi:hypothetical protein
MMEFVSWDDDIPNMMGKKKVVFQTSNQMRQHERINSRFLPWLFRSVPIEIQRLTTISKEGSLVHVTSTPSPHFPRGGKDF